MRQPQEAPPPGGPLAATLREWRDRTGLSLAALAARTPYSKSAWHRYLSGAQHPPRSAVEALAGLAGADPVDGLTLWETAGHTTPLSDAPDGGGHGLDGELGESGSGDSTRRSDRWKRRSGTTDATRWRRPLPRRLPLPALTLLTALAAVAAAVTASSRTGSAGPRVVMAWPRCHGHSCQGELPDASACSRDAQTKSSVTDTAHTVRLRYSPSCGTAWSEVRVRGTGLREISVRLGQDVLSATYAEGDTDGYTSPMLAVSSPRGVEACAEVAGELACTGLDADAPR